jgi:hypothetical protein
VGSAPGRQGGEETRQVEKRNVLGAVGLEMRKWGCSFGEEKMFVSLVHLLTFLFSTLTPRGCSFGEEKMFV